MKRLGSELSGQLDPKRTRQGNEDVQAAQSGALATNNEQGLVNQELSSLPAQTLLVTGQALGKSAATNQARQINASIANTVGQTEGVVTNAALNTDLFHGAIAPQLQEQKALEEATEHEAEVLRYKWISRLMSLGSINTPDQFKNLLSQPVSMIKQLVETQEGDLQSKQAAEENEQATQLAGININNQPPQAQPVQPAGQVGQPTIQTQAQAQAQAQTQAQAQPQQTTGTSDPATDVPSNGSNANRRLGNASWTSQPVYFDDTGAQRVKTFAPPNGVQRGQEDQYASGVLINPLVSGGNDETQEEENPGLGRYENELRPFLPLGGSDLFTDTRDERLQKSLNQALFDSIIRDPETGDSNINPLQMGIVIENAIRFSGDHKVFDPVFPGGSLNTGSLPATSERLEIPAHILQMEHCKLQCARKQKKRHSSVNDYLNKLALAAASALPAQTRDVRWVLQNQGNRDSQHSSASNNVMPVESNWWASKRQDDGEVPLQANLLPAQALDVDAQLGFNNAQTSSIYADMARHAVTWNPASLRFGWVPGNPFA